MKRITFIRHAKVDMDSSRPICARSLKEWEEAYNSAPISKVLPKKELVKRIHDADYVISSTHRRSIDSLALIEVRIDEQNRLFITTYPKSDILIGVKKNKSFSSKNVSQCFPNPASENTIVKVDLNKSSEVYFELTNLVGQVVYTSPIQLLNRGSHNLTIDVTQINPGVYFYTV